MKVLLLSATIGQGHNNCAQSIANTFKKRGCDTKIIDMYGEVSLHLKQLISTSYTTSINLVNNPYTRFLGTLTYATMEKKYKNRQSKELAIYNRLCKEMLTLIKKENPDVIICTQVNCVQVVNELKKQGHIKALTIGILTDFTVQSIWSNTKYIDYIVTPHQSLTYKFTELGVDSRKILPFGIPINEIFSKKLDMQKCRELLKVHADKKTILLTGGSMGYGDIDKSIKELDSLDVDFQMIVICGNNQRLYNKLIKLKTKKLIKIYGYTKHINIMMGASDIIITKPGGISISESLATSMAIIVNNPIPGMEDRNKEFLLNHGIAMSISKSFPLKDAVYFMLKNKILFETKKTISYLNSNPNSTVQLYNFVKDNFDQKYLI